jgi:serine/threonine-protein kinase 24/25/MST4
MEKSGKNGANSEIGSRYAKKEILGKGGFGTVYRALDTKENKDVAVKIINLEDAGDEIEDIQTEISIMASHSPSSGWNNLITYYNSHVFGNELWIIMEYLDGGSLADILENFTLNEDCIAFIMKKLLTALSHLHEDRKLHRDVKAGNILISSKGVVKLGDFGATGQLSDSMTKRKTKIGM